MVPARSKRVMSARTPKRPPLSYANVVSTLALFLALSGGTALALTGSNTVTSDDIVNGQVKTGDLAGSSVATGKVADNSLLPRDIKPNSLGGGRIDESRLGQVPSAALGGKGRSGLGPAFCVPGETGYKDCASVDLSLPAPARVAVIGGLVGWSGFNREADTSVAGTCRIGTSLRIFDPLDPSALYYPYIPGSERDFDIHQGEEAEPLTVTGITQVLPAGNYGFYLECDDTTPATPGADALLVTYGKVTAIALSPG
jgi:hypothetical protein